tara:strand:+ start:43888 stop:44370 length:483 start_codon:yes stop_codon:yes gene_type:complete
MAYSTDNLGDRVHTYASPGIMSTGAYLVGARPFIVKALLDDGKVYKVEFPFVTRAITVINQDALNDDVLIAFANHGDAWDHHAITLANNRDSITMNVRTPSLYLKASGDVHIELFAEMTNIVSGRHDEWASSDQSRSGIDLNIAGATYPSAAATNDIIEQ